MRPIALNPDIAPPRNVRAVTGLLEARRTTIPELCAAAGIELRVSCNRWQPVVVHAGTEHLRTPTTAFVGLGRVRCSNRVRALRALEVLAHGFHDYAARECVCGRGLFVAPARRGRPPLGRRAMTAKERMRKMRCP